MKKKLNGLHLSAVDKCKYSKAADFNLNSKKRLSPLFLSLFFFLQQYADHSALAFIDYPAQGLS